MKNYLLFVLFIFLIGCSKGSIKNSSDVTSGDITDGRYNYFLTEAIRQNYFGKGGDAISLFEKCIELDPERSLPYYELAQIYASSGMGRVALENASKAARLDKENFWYQMTCGSLFMQYNERDSALLYFLKAVKIRPDEVEVNAMIAGIYAEKGKLRESDSILIKLDDLGIINEEAFVMLVSGLVEEGNHAEAAKRTIKKIDLAPSEIKFKALLADIYIEQGLNAKGDSIYTSMIEENPENIDSQLYVMANMIKQKDYSGADSFLSSIFENGLVNVDKKKAIAQELLRDSVYRSEQAEVFEKKLIILERKYSDDDEILSFRPQLYESLKRNKEAIERYEEIIKTKKQYYYFKEKLLILYAIEKEYEKLFSLASSYSKENNRSILGKFYFALSAIELKKYSIAEDELKKALILAGNDDQLKVQIYSMMGDLYNRMKRNEESVKFLDKALSINPEDITVLNNYAYYLAEENKELEKALKMAEKVMKMEGNNSTYIDTYAWILYKMNRKKEALREMKKIFDASEENDPEILEHMGFIMKDLKNCDQAMLYWQRAVNQDSTKEYLIEEIEKCKSGIK